VTADRVTLNAGSTVAATVTVSARLQDGSAVPDDSSLAVNTNLGYFKDADGNSVQLISVKTANGAATLQFFAGADIGTANLLAQLGTSVGRLTVSITTAPIPPVADFEVNASGLRAIFTNLSTGTPTPTYAWDFGDKTPIVTSAAPIHDYALAGTYTITLTAKNDGGSNARSRFLTVTPTPLLASFTSKATGLTVGFTDTSVGNPASWLWDFGDGPNATSTLQNPQYTYQAPGTYNVTLNISGGGQTASAKNFVTVSAMAPAADFTYAATNLQVSFTDTSTNSPTSWSWNFGDNSALDTSRNPVHVYPMAGVYAVALTVQNAVGPSTKSKFVTVTVPPKASFVAQPVGLDVAFIDTSTGSPTEWEWDFGDNTPLDTRENPTHHYEDGGNYTVTLKVTNSAGASTISQILPIVGPPSAAFTSSPATDDTLTWNFLDVSSGSPTSWQWTFGDCNLQSVCTSSDQHPTHTYVQPGEYIVVLTVTNTAGHDAKQSTLKAGLPVASFNYDQEGSQVTFIDQSTNNPTSYFWTFGCGEADCTSTQQNPVHIYSAAGQYSVKLVVSNAAGQNSTSKIITIP
jgi:PKD repeat protein